MSNLKKHWMLYFKESEPLFKYNHTKASEERQINDNEFELLIVGCFGGRKEKDAPIGDKVIVTKDKLKLGYIPKKHDDELFSRIKTLETKYIDKLENFWWLTSVVSFYKVLDFIEKNDGVVDDKLIESIFESEKQTYWISFSDKYINIVISTSLINLKHKEISSLEALKMFGLARLETAHEKTIAHISVAEYRKTKLDKI